MRFYPAGDQIPGESNLLLILLTNHRSITLPFCNDSNPIKACSDYFEHFYTDIQEARSQQGEEEPAAPPCQHQGGLVFWSQAM